MSSLGLHAFLREAMGWGFTSVLGEKSHKGLASLLPSSPPPPSVFSLSQQGFILDPTQNFTNTVERQLQRNGKGQDLAWPPPPFGAATWGGRTVGPGLLSGPTRHQVV